MVRDILLLGDPRLYEPSAPIPPEEIPALEPVIADLHDTLMDFRQKHGAGRAVAAPQIGVPKRLIYMHIEEPIAFINPELIFPSGEKFEVMDDCMSFPGLLVRVERFRSCRIDFLDMQGSPRSYLLEDDLAELIQHEYDHLDGILATMRAVDGKAFYYK